MSLPVVTLAGVALAGPGDWVWADVPGPSPVAVRWTVSRHTYDLLAAQESNPLGLVIRAGETVLEQRFVWLRDVHLPDDAAHLAILELTDLRWIASRVYVRKSFNVCRATADKVVAARGALPENLQLLDDVRYAAYSLREGKTAWVAGELVAWLVGRLGVDADMGGLPETAVEVQDLVLDGPGDVALEAVLAFFPGWGVRVSRDGLALQFYDRLPTAARADELMLTYEGSQHLEASSVRWVDRSRSRPSSVRVLFRPVLELRLDYSEAASQTRDTNGLLAVLEVTDASGVVVDGVNHARGSFVQQAAVFAAWGAFGAQTRAVSLGLLAVLLMAPGPSRFLHEFAHEPNQALPNPVWVQRATEAAQAYRQTYQVEPVFYGRLRSLSLTRPHVVSRDLRAFAEAEVYCPWTRRLSWHSFATGKNQGGAALGVAVDGHPATDLLSDFVRAPAEVALVGEGGVLRIVPRQDPQGIYDGTVWGLPAQSLGGGGWVLPQQDLGLANRNALDLYVRWDYLELSTSFALSLLCSAEVGDATYAIEVELDEPGRGPPLTLALDVYPALIAWSDDQRENILDVVRGDAAPETLSGLLLNGGLLQELAEAAALRVAEVYRDQWEGRLSLDAGRAGDRLQPIGNVGSITRAVRGGGATVAEIDLVAVTQPAELERYLSRSARRAIRNILSEEKR